MAAAQLSYAVPPQEQPYYEGLFQVADRSRSGFISGGDAVPFFALSKLTVETLKNIWTLSDQPASNSLDRRKFAVALRLIQFSQNGVKAQGAQLQGPPGMRPPMFEGVSGVSVPLPPAEGPPPQQQFAQPPQQQGPPPPQQQFAPPPQQQGPPPPQQQFAPPPQQQGPPPPQQQFAPPPQQQGPPPPQQQFAPPPQQQGPPPPPQQFAQPPHQQYGAPPPTQPPRAPLAPTSYMPSHPQQIPPSPSQPVAPPQQMAPPTPPRPPTPSRPPMGGPPPAFSMALTPQDPYTMTPQEQARYEGLFPSYAGPDGFVHGKEAVELFTKSNIPQDQLGKIWNLVDSPVDNKLDKLEFAMAMHLIVCVSKKNLPTPTSLPISLKILKSQQPEAVPNSAVEPYGHEGLPSSDLSTQQLASPPPLQQQQPPVSLSVQQQYSAPSSPQPRYSTPPPLQSLGGGAMAISDAFEGLNPAAAAHGYDKPVNFDSSPAMPSFSFNAPAQSSFPEPHREPTPEPKSIPEPMYARAPSPLPPPPSTEQLASNYHMGDDFEELKKLKATLQRLQAENIALRAQMGSLSEEERAMQREAMATVAEIGRLSAELSEVRSQVMSTKARLLESSAELAAAKEKKSVFSDLISEAKATKEVLEVATHDLHEAAEKLQTIPAPLPAPVAEEDLFGGWGAPAPPPAASWSAPAPAPQVAQIDTYQPPVEQFNQQVTVTASSYDSGDAFDSNPVLKSPIPSGLHAYGQDPLAGSTATKEGIENARKAALTAQTKARELEETFEALSQETESLRKIAEEAEAEAAAKQEKASAKRLGKKKSMKEAEQAAVEAAGKKKHYLEMQAQTSNARTIAEAGKKEAERLRSLAEQAEIDFASAESTKVTNGHGHSWEASNPPVQSYPSYGIDQSKAAPAFGSNQGYGNGVPPHLIMQPQTSDDSQSFGGAIMGGGSGLSIPTPSGGDDYNYNNPF